MAVLFHNLSIDQANSYGLVLASSRIPYEINEGIDGWELSVWDGDVEKALHTIHQYIEENKAHVLAKQSTQAPLGKNRSGIWVALALMGLHIVFRSSSMVDDLFQKYGSSASHILDGELYRTVTSLMLHNGTAHLVGNMVGIALFGTAVCTITGMGLGWLMILSAGAGGNLCNAFFYHSGHLSVGASTAVFGAVGILCSEQFFKRFTSGQAQKMKAWIPLAGGLALLGLLGTGVRADLMAHLFGFLVGLVLGLVDAGLAKKWSTTRCQIISILLVSGIVILALLSPLLGS